MAKKSAKKRVSPKELERMWKNVNLPNFWREVSEKALPEMEAYRIARAKSRGVNQVFI